MRFRDYNQLSYQIKFFRALRVGIITLLVAALVVAPGLIYWQASIVKRATLREAKNVVLNMNLLAAEFRATGNPVRDTSRRNGLNAQAEARIRSCAGADGGIRLVAWNAQAGRVTSVVYHKGHYLCDYYYDLETDSTTWRVYYLLNQYQNEP